MSCPLRREAAKPCLCFGERVRAGAAIKGKQFVYNHHLTVPFRALEMHADKEVGEARLDGNLIVHGDNLHALMASNWLAILTRDTSASCWPC